jgi:hypothetical protein
MTKISKLLNHFPSIIHLWENNIFLREFCNEFHPEVDFDTEFETHKLCFWKISGKIWT